MAGQKKIGRPRGAGVPIQMRISHELAAAIDREVERIQKERPGNEFKRADIIREIVGRALLTESKPAKR